MTRFLGLDMVLEIDHAEVRVPCLPAAAPWLDATGLGRVVGHLTFTLAVNQARRKLGAWRAATGPVTASRLVAFQVRLFPDRRSGLPMPRALVDLAARRHVPILVVTGWKAALHGTALPFPRHDGTAGLKPGLRVGAGMGRGGIHAALREDGYLREFEPSEDVDDEVWASTDADDLARFDSGDVRHHGVTLVAFSAPGYAVVAFEPSFLASISARRLRVQFHAMPNP